MAEVEKLKRVLKFIAFDEGERFLMQSKSTFLEFLRGIHRYKFGHPKKFFTEANYSGRMT